MNAPKSKRRYFRIRPVDLIVSVQVERKLGKLVITSSESSMEMIEAAIRQFKAKENGSK